MFLFVTNWGVTLRKGEIMGMRWMGAPMAWRERRPLAEEVNAGVRNISIMVIVDGGWDD